MSTKQAVLQEFGVSPSDAPHIAGISSGLILVGSAPGRGRTINAHRLAAILVDDPTKIITVAPGAPDTHFGHRHHIGTSGQRSETQALHEAVRAGASTVIFDGAPEIASLAYAVTLADAGWLVIATVPLDDIDQLIEVTLQSRRQACYPRLRAGEHMAAEDVTTTLQLVWATGPHDSEEYLLLDDTTRADILAQFSPAGT